MAKAVFHSEFNYSSQKTKFGWSVRPSEKPQSFPRELIDAACRAGVATRVPSKVPKSGSHAVSGQSKPASSGAQKVEQEHG